MLRPMLPGPFELKGGCLIWKSPNVTDSRPGVSSRGRCSTGLQTIMLTEPAIEIVRHSNIRGSSLRDEKIDCPHLLLRARIRWRVEAHPLGQLLLAFL